MATHQAMAAIQACVTNRLDWETIGDRRIAGVIGEAPSRYSKSPALWNAAFALLDMSAVYLPFDLEKSKLKAFSAVLRATDSIMGINVTVPHKVAIIDHLDELDPGAARIQAVNSLVRTQDGRLIGYNTDGEGFVDSILKPQPGSAESFVASLSGADVLLLGAGGSARAVAFHVGELLGNGKLVICNRTVEHARALANDIRRTGYQAHAIGEDELRHWAPKVTLIINCTIKGQGGLSSLEPYSALAPGLVVIVREAESGQVEPSGARAQAAEAAIKRNNEASLSLASAIPTAVRFYDLIYHPEETVFLRHGRETGHMTMNGRAMIVNQAVIAFCKRICSAELQGRGKDNAATYERILTTMYNAW
jgi:shikimate dehydrogenase